MTATQRGMLACWIAAIVFACSADDPEPTAPDTDTGRELFVQYCASCHGSGGSGDGPVAASLTPAPADLTTLAQRNDGVFDELAVLSTIDGRREIAAHGPRDMPVWGAVFASEHAAAGQLQAEQISFLLTNILSDYVASLQKK